MTRSQKRTFNQLLIFLIILVLMLTIALLVRRRIEAKEAADSSTSSAQTETVQSPAATTMAWKNGDTSLSFSLGSDGTWYWDGDEEFPLDNTLFTGLASLLSPFSPTKTIASGDTLTADGLNENSPSMTVGFQDGTQTVLTFGAQVPSGTDHYMLRSEDPSKVYVIGGNAPQMISSAVYDLMKLPELPVMNTVYSVMLSSNGNEVLATSTDGSAWQWDGKDISSNQTLTALLVRMELASIAKCENFKPTEAGLALWGMDAPAVTAQFVYDDEQLLTLQIGNQTLDGSGYYIRMNDDTTIYSISAYSLEPILTAAQNGFVDAAQN